MFQDHRSADRDPEQGHSRTDKVGDRGQPARKATMNHSDCCPDHHGGEHPRVDIPSVYEPTDCLYRSSYHESDCGQIDYRPVERPTSGIDLGRVRAEPSTQPETQPDEGTTSHNQEAEPERQFLWPTDIAV